MSDEFYRRVRDARKSKGLTIREVAEATGVSRGHISEYETNKTNLESKKLMSICRFLDIDFGAGIQSDVKSDYIHVPRYEVKASAGGGAVITSEQIVDYLAFKPEWLTSAKGITPENLVLISVIGDSMMPTIRDGDLILIDTTPTRFKSDAIYVIQHSDRLWVKRVQYRLDGVVVIKSDNSANYEPESFREDQLDGIRIIGRVVWRGGDL